MVDFATRLQTMPVRAEVPGGLLRGELRDASEVVISFGGEGYYRTTEADLERQLVNLCRLLVVAWTRGYWDALSEAAGHRIASEPAPYSEASAEYRTARDALVVTGRSADGHLTITYDPTNDGWQATIQPGTIAALSEEEFVTAARQASRELYAQRRQQIVALKLEIFGRDARKNAEPR